MSGIAFAFNFSCFVALYYFASINVIAAKISGAFVGFWVNYIYSSAVLHFLADSFAQTRIRRRPVPASPF